MCYSSGDISISRVIIWDARIIHVFYATTGCRMWCTMQAGKAAFKNIKANLFCSWSVHQADTKRNMFTALLFTWPSSFDFNREILVYDVSPGRNSWWKVTEIEKHWLIFHVCTAAQSHCEVSMLDCRDGWTQSCPANLVSGRSSNNVYHD